MQTSPPAASDSSWALWGWASYDWANSAFPTVIQTFVFPAYFIRQIATDVTTGTNQWGNTISIAGVIVAVSAPFLGAIADQSGRRKPWVAAFMFLCVVATALLWFIRPSTELIWAALILVALGTVGVELAEVFYNAMLPGLAPQSQMGRWSGWAWGLGYVGGLSCLAVALMAFVRFGPMWFAFEPELAEGVRATFPLVAVWYLVFSAPLFLLVPDVPRRKRMTRAVRDGLSQLRESVHQVRRYRPVFHFLIARMIYADGLATLFAFGGVYAAGTFGMAEQQILLFGIALNVTAGLGAAAFSWIDDWIGGRRTVLLALIGLIVPGALILFVRSQSWFWALCLFLGLFVGPVQAASRSLLARSAPKPIVNEVFGLYAFSGRATAFIGPLLVGWITFLTGSQRIGMSAIIGLLILGFLLMLRTPSNMESEPTFPETQQ